MVFIRVLYLGQIGIWSVAGFLWREFNERTRRKTVGARREPTANSTYLWRRATFLWGKRSRRCDIPCSLFSVFTSHVIKIKIVTMQWKTSRVWDTLDDWYINDLAKNQVFAVFHSRVSCRLSVSPKFIELCMGAPCLCPSEGHKHGGRKVTETSVTEFCYWNAKLLL